MDGFLIVGYLSSGQDRAFHSAEPVRSPQHIAQTLHAERIDAVMTVGSVIPEDLVTLMRGLEGTQVRLVVAPGLQDVVPGRMRALTVTHGWTGLIAVKTRRTRAAGKALFDRLAGAIGLALISPLLAATALAIRLDSPRSGLLHPDPRGPGRQALHHVEVPLHVHRLRRAPRLGGQGRRRRRQRGHVQGPSGPAHHPRGPLDPPPVD